jgi:hypothetical protein
MTTVRLGAAPESRDTLGCLFPGAFAFHLGGLSRNSRGLCIGMGFDAVPFPTPGARREHERLPKGFRKF